MSIFVAITIILAAPVFAGMLAAVWMNWIEPAIRRAADDRKRRIR